MASDVPEKTDTRRFRGLDIRQLVSVGTHMAVGVAIFALLGNWADRRRGDGYVWTLAGTFVGLSYGAYEVWKAVRALDEDDTETPVNTSRGRSGDDSEQPSA